MALPKPGNEPEFSPSPEPDHPYRRLAAAGLVLGMAAITVISHLPHPHVPVGRFVHDDKVYHFLAYAVLGGLGFLSRRGSVNRKFTSAFLLVAAFGAADEIHQAFVPGRSMSALDWLADAVGAAAGAWGARFFPGSEKKSKFL